MSSQASGSNSTWWSATKAVAWSFLGIRKGSAFQDDVTRLKPYHLIAAGIVGVLLFILFLIGLVNWIVAK